MAEDYNNINLYARYGSNPVEILDKNSRAYYDHNVELLFKQNALFSGLVTYAMNLGDVRASSMHVTQVIQPHTNTNPLGVRQMWSPAMHIDSREKEITFVRQGNKVALHKYDELITYWKAQGEQAGMRAILRRALGPNIINTHNMLARNAFIKGAFQTGYVLYPEGKSNFNGITPVDKYDPWIGADIQLGMQYRGVATGIGPNGSPGTVFCYTTPGVIYDIQKEEEWQDIHSYANPTSILRYEVGSFKGVRYISHPDMVLWNAGKIVARAPLNAARIAGSGSPTNKVDGVYTVGQGSVGIANDISLGSFTTGAITDIKVGDMVTVHLTTTASYGVTAGVDPFEGHVHNRRVVEIDADEGTIAFDLPLMEDFTTDLGAGVYGYLTKAENVHSSLFVGGPNGVAAGVAEPIRLYNPPAIDDFGSMWRFSWDSRIGYEPWVPEVFECLFTSGSYRFKGETRSGHGVEYP